jgi:hypothetical protein
MIALNDAHKTVKAIQLLLEEYDVILVRIADFREQTNICLISDNDLCKYLA